MFGRRQTGSAVPLTDVQPPAQAPTVESVPEVVASSQRAKPATPNPFDDDMPVEAAVERVLPPVRKAIDPGKAIKVSRGELAKQVRGIVDELCDGGVLTLEDEARRLVVAGVVSQFLTEAKRQVKETAETDGGKSTSSGNSIIEEAKQRIQPILMERIDVAKAVTLPRAELSSQISDIVSEILVEEKMQLNVTEQRDLITTLLDDMLGLGPLEVLLDDDAVTDIMVNGPKQVYVERGGKLELTDVTFRNDAHVMNIATRIVTRIGRRVDETTPLVDARLQDGSRVNIIISPLTLDGPSISIRKFAKQKITLEKMEETKNLSPEMATVLKIAGRCRLNILISGGTGSGKTTLLNAMSRMIDNGERIVTIEDAAELQLQQPHVVRLETRPPNLEGQGEITQRELVKNTLRMRPDRIILGEIRAGEALDMLQAMNTGHDGSMCTVHANRPREALTRLENMVAMTGVKLPAEAVRAQIAGAVHMIVQIARMRDGIRRITHITEVVGMEGEVVTTQDLFTFHYKGEDENGRLFGEFKSSGLRPNFSTKAEYFGLDRALMEAMNSGSGADL